MTKQLKPIFLNSLTPPSIFTLICLSAIGALAINIFLPSLPSMAKTFGVTYATATLTITLFLAMNAVFEPFAGPLSDQFGRRPIVLASLIIFCLSSFGCILATSFEIFLTCRLLQSVVVACLALSRAAIRDVHSESQAASVLGYVTMGMGMAILPLVGPAVGGVLEVQFDWIASFWVLFGIGILVFLLAYLDMGETNKNRTKSMASQFKAYPELLSSCRFWGYCFTAIFSAGAYFTYLGGAAFVGREVFGLSPAELGLYLGAPAIGYIIENGLSGKFSIKIGINKMILTGALITAFGMLLCISLFLFTMPIPLSFFGCISSMGIRNGMVLPNATSGMMSVRSHLAGSVSRISGTINTAGGALIATVTSAILIPGTSALPLLIIMLVSTIMAILTITYVIKRAKDLSIANLSLQTLYARLKYVKIETLCWIKATRIATQS